MLQKFAHVRKKQYFCTRSPGNSSPRYNAGDESGFFVFMDRSELEILTEGFPELVEERIDPFDKVSAEIRKEMGWK